MNKDQISQIKKSVVAIGLINKDGVARKIIGSGFTVTSDEHIITASHVITSCENQRIKIKKEENEDTWLSIFDYIPNGNEYRLVSSPFDKYQFLGLKSGITAYNVDLDVAVLQPTSPKTGHVFLPISNRTQFSVLEEIYVCGYPGGRTSFRSDVHPTDISLSPTIQHGRITALKPADNATTHQGIITDIIGVGGSSGSPIVDEGCEVVGIAQSVIPGVIYDGIGHYIQPRYILNSETGELVESEIKSKAPLQGHVNVGMIYGFSSTMFTKIGVYSKDILDGKPIPKDFQAHYSIKESV